MDTGNWLWMGLWARPYFIARWALGMSLLYCYIYSCEYLPLIARTKKLGSLEARKLGGKAPLAQDEYKKGAKGLNSG